MSSPQIADRLCLDRGHNFQTHKVGEMLTPDGKMVIGKFQTLCVQCGLTVETCRKRRLRNKKASINATA